MRCRSRQLDRAAATLAAIHSSPPAPACVPPVFASASWPSCPSLVPPLPAASLLRALLRRLPSWAAEAACSLPPFTAVPQRAFSRGTAAILVAPSSCTWHHRWVVMSMPLVTLAEARPHAMQGNNCKSTLRMRHTADMQYTIALCIKASMYVMGMASPDSPRPATGPARRVQSGRCPGR